MKSLARTRMGPVALEILGYLCAHKDAQDTVEGIAEWWLLEQDIRHAVLEVKQALEDLVSQGMIVVQQGPDGRRRYGLNPRKRATIEQVLGAAKVGRARRPGVAGSE